MARTPEADFRTIRVGNVTVTSLSDGMMETPVRPGIVRNADHDDVRAALVF